jgi:glucose-1-phosphate thymidylyltransferase
MPPAEPLHGIVMAAGDGTRMRPITERWAKAVLPIDGRPVVAHVVRELHEAGCAPVTVVTGHLAEQVEELLGDGSAFGVELRYVRQVRPDGSADAVRRALDGGADVPSVVVAADTLFDPGALAHFRRQWESSGAPGAIGVRRGQPRSGGKLTIDVRDGLVVRVIVEDPDREFTPAPLWGLGEALVDALEGLPGPPFELGDAYQRSIDAGTEVRAVLIGDSRDLTAPADLVLENFPYLA